MARMLRVNTLVLLLGGILLGCQEPDRTSVGSSKSSKVATPAPLAGSKGDVVAVVFTSVDCPIANAMAPELDRIYADAKARDVRCYLVYPRTGTTEVMMSEHAAEYDLSGDRIADVDHVLVEELDARVTPEAYVLEFTGPNQWRVLYRGRVNDLYPSIGNRRVEATQHDFQQAIIAAVSNESISVAQPKAVGCMIQRRN